MHVYRSRGVHPSRHRLGNYEDIILRWFQRIVEGETVPQARFLRFAQEMTHKKYIGWKFAKDGAAIIDDKQSDDEPGGNHLDDLNEDFDIFKDEPDDEEVFEDVQSIPSDLFGDNLGEDNLHPIYEVEGNHGREENSSELENSASSSSSVDDMKNHVLHAVYGGSWDGEPGDRLKLQDEEVKDEVKEEEDFVSVVGVEEEY